MRKVLEKQGKPTPGPGQYNNSMVLKKTNPLYTLGTDKRVTVKPLNTNPGPGMHDSSS